MSGSGLRVTMAARGRRANRLAAAVVVVLGACGAAALASSAFASSALAGHHKLRKVHVTESLSASSLYPKQKLGVTGRLSPAKVGQQVQLQLLEGHKWTTVAKTGVNGQGAFGFTTTPIRAGYSEYRVYRKQSRRYAAGASPARKVLVYFMHYLSDIQPVGYMYFAPYTGSQEVNGVTYAHSIYDPRLGGASCDPSETWDYNLKRAATLFRAVVGMSDNSPSSTGVTFTVITDGIQRGSWGPLTLGHSATIRLSVKGNLRLELKMNYVEGRSDYCPNGNAVWGNANFYSSK